MNRLLALTALLTAGAFNLAVTHHAAADDYSSIPAQTRAQIKAKCVAEHPGDFGMQHGCILLQSDSYLAVEGFAPVVDPEWEPGGLMYEMAPSEVAYRTLCPDDGSGEQSPELDRLVARDGKILTQASELVSAVRERAKTLPTAVADLCKFKTGFDGNPFQPIAE